MIPTRPRDLLNKHIPKTATVSIQTQETDVNAGMAYDGIGNQDSDVPEDK